MTLISNRQSLAEKRDSQIILLLRNRGGMLTTREVADIMKLPITLARASLHRLEKRLLVEGFDGEGNGLGTVIHWKATKL